MNRGTEASWLLHASGGLKGAASSWMLTAVSGIETTTTKHLPCKSAPSGGGIVSQRR